MLNEKQAQIFEMAMAGKNLFITGSAGTGKSYLTNKIVEAMTRDGKRIVKCAYTGVAARNIDGFTLHHQFHINTRDCNVKNTVINKWIGDTDLIVIDEISMVPFYMFNTIGNEIKRHNPNCQVIVIGDFFQLPPVVGDKEIGIAKRRGYDIKDKDKFHCFHSFNWKDFNFITCTLTQSMRQQDQNFSTALYNLSRGNLTDEDKNFLRTAQQNSEIKDDDVIILSCLKRTVDKINSEKLNAIDSPSHTYVASHWGEYDKDVPEELDLKVGAKVIMTVNNVAKGYCNGDIGFITEMGQKFIKVKLVESGTNIVVEPFEFGTYVMEEGQVKMIGKIKQFPLRLAWAMTVHKSQGQTFNKVNFLYDYGFFEGSSANLTLLYVGMSRVREISNLYLRFKTALPPFTNEDVLDFYNNKYEIYISKYDSRGPVIGF